MLRDLTEQAAVLISIALIAGGLLNLHEITKHIVVWN